MRFLSRDDIFGTLFLFAFMGLLTFIPSFDHLDPISDALRDYETTDIVFSTLQEEPPADTNITIVNIAQVDRATIGRMLEIIGRYKPAVVGIDAFFRSEKGPAQDFPLMMGMAKIDNLVLVSELDSLSDDKENWHEVNYSNSMFMEHATSGFANVITGEQTHGNFRTVREFVPSFIVNDTLVTNFTTKIVSLFDSSAYRDLMKRNNHLETINWKGNYKKFTHLDYDDVLNERFGPGAVKDKIVLFGYIGEYVGDKDSYIDKFFTPMNERPAGRTYPDMYGIVVHANVISMILNRNYIDSADSWVNILISILVAYFNVALFLWVAHRYKALYDLITKPFQIFELIFLVFVSVILLLNFQIKLNLTVTLIAIAFSGDLTELYYGSVKGLALRQWEKITHHGSKPNDSSSNE